MRWQTTAVLALVLAALSAFYYLYEIRGGPAREKASAEKGRLWTVEATDIVELTLSRAEGTIRLKREGDGWMMIEPLRARGDRGRVDETLTTLLTARIDREIDPAPTRLGEFGLDKPAVEITLRPKEGPPLALALGSKNPTGVWVYARLADKPAVFVLGESVLRDTTRPRDDFRDRTVLAFDTRSVSGLEIAMREETIVVEPAASGWKLTRPRELPADADTIRDLLEKLQTQKVKEFVAEAPTSLVPYGLERPVRVMIHTGRDKDRATKTLLLGREDKAKKGVYAMRPGETSVLLLPEELWAAVPKNVAALRNRVVLDFERDKITRIELESPKGTATLARDGSRWRITAPEALPADPVEAGAILFKLRELRAQGFVADDAAGVARYLGKPTVRVTVAEEGAAEPKTLLLAPSAERRGGQPSAYAGLAGRGPVVLVDAKALDELSRSVLDLRDRTFVPGLDAKDVKRLRVRAGGQTVTVERRGDAEWRFVEGATGGAKGSVVENLLYTLRALKWKDIVAPAAQEAAKYGLDAPVFEAALLRADGSEIAAVLIGKREGDRTYARLKAQPAIYAVDTPALGELPKLPDDFKG